MPAPFSPSTVLVQVEENHVKFVDLQFTDVVGVIKNGTIPASELPEALERGIWFDGSSIEGFARIAESDMHLRPDPATFALLPWLTGDQATARLILDVYTPEGHPFQGNPRAALKRSLEEAARFGFVFNTGPELEFFLLEPHPGEGLVPAVPHDRAGYFDAPSDVADGLRRKLTAALVAFGIQVDSTHHEIATGQNEVDIRYSNALTMADNVVTFRSVLKIIAQLHGLYGTFMPKPLCDAAGSGMHVHQSLSYAEMGKNAFADPGDPHGLSRIGKHFIAGQLAHARGMCAVLAPLVNSYKWLVAGYEAPVQISWARMNRSALIRVPRTSRAESTRLELRCPDPSCNPYLAFAVMLAAGLDGIRRELPVPEAREENLYVPDHPRRSGLELLPGTLNEALNALEQDVVIRDALGPVLCESFLSAKRLEWEDYSLQVISWELNKYLPSF